MPAFVGAAKVNSIGSGGVFHIGDVFVIAPVAIAKTFAGAGSFITGDGTYVNNRQNNTNTYDANFADQNLIANA